MEEIIQTVMVRALTTELLAHILYLTVIVYYVTFLRLLLSLEIVRLPRLKVFGNDDGRTKQQLLMKDRLEL
jgi:hypothetical protein